MLRTKLRFPERTSVLNHWGISPVLAPYVFTLVLGIKLRSSSLQHLKWAICPALNKLLWIPFSKLLDHKPLDCLSSLKKKTVLLFWSKSLQIVLSFSFHYITHALAIPASSTFKYNPILTTYLLHICASSVLTSQFSAMFLLVLLECYTLFSEMIII